MLIIILVFSWYSCTLSFLIHAKKYQPLFLSCSPTYHEPCFSSFLNKYNLVSSCFLHAASQLASVAAFCLQLCSYTEQSLQEHAGLIDVNMSKCEPHVQKKDENAVIMRCHFCPPFIMLDKHSFGIWWGECGQLKKEMQFYLPYFCYFEARGC